MTRLVTSALELTEQRRIPFTLSSGDLCDLTPDTPYDVLLLSGKYAKNYGDRSAFYPSRRSVLGALKYAFGLDFSNLPDNCEFEYYADNRLDEMTDGLPFDAQRHTWCLLSKPLVSHTDRALPFSRVLIVVPPRSYALEDYTLAWTCIDHAFNALSLWYTTQPEPERAQLKILSTMLSLGNTPSQSAHRDTLETIIRNTCNRAISLLGGFDLITYFSERGSPFRLKQDHDNFYVDCFRKSIDEHQERIKPQKRSDLFISYRRDRKSEVDEFVQRFRQMYPEREVWYDQDIQAGDAWQSAIIRNMASARVCLMLISDGFLTSPHCLDELRFAIDLERTRSGYLFPVLIGGEADYDQLVGLAPSFANTQFELSTWEEVPSYIETLNARLESLTERSLNEETRQ